LYTNYNLLKQIQKKLMCYRKARLKKMKK